MNSDEEQKQDWQQPVDAGAQAPYQTPVDQESPVNEEFTESDELPQTADASDQEEAVSQDDESVVRWQATEYIQHERTGLWYIIFALVTAVLAVFALLVVRSVTFSILIPVMAAALFVYTRRPPAILNYVLSRKGLHVNDRLYPYSDFRSFSVVSHAGHHSALLVPRKRFQLGQTVYFSEQEGEAIVDMLAARLPMQQAKPDIYDQIISKLRL